MLTLAHTISSDWFTGNGCFQPFKEFVKQMELAIQHKFDPQMPVDHLLKEKSELIDEILISGWQHFLTDQADSHCLLAVGGYGRKELFPYSDIDVAIVLNTEIDPVVHERMASFATFLWDIGLKPGLSVRSIAETVTAAKGNQTIMTNIMENRLIAGSHDLYKKLLDEVGPDKIWPSRQFFAAKMLEQAQRHEKYHDTAYNLEPNIKEGPGGLRDFQVIIWAFKRHYNSATLKELINIGFLTEFEYNQLFSAQQVLWRIRYALHVLNNRSEDRLLFEHQRELATQFGFFNEAEHYNQDVELFMQFYFKTILDIQRFNEMLLQLFNERFVLGKSAGEPKPLGEYFIVVNNYLEAKDEKVFERQPIMLLEIFLILEKNNDLKGVGATTIRLIRKSLHLIDDAFRQDKTANNLFVEIFRQPQGITTQLRRMSRYGVLAAYLPHFANIMARMQYDLFHFYTVDAHTLFVIRNLRRFAIDKHRNELPFCNELFLFIRKPEILYISALFHDIAKGQEGDHSAIGEAIVETFCLQHDFTPYDRRLVSWLVSNHLLMSTTAQRKDIHDPDVILEFAHKVGSIEYLNHLYLLTVADIRATNPKLWNSWKDSLIKELYSAARSVLRRGLQRPLGMDNRIMENKKEALDELLGLGFRKSDLEKIWQDISGDYFLRYTVDEIVWHTYAIASAKETDLPLVLFRSQTRLGNAEIFIYAKKRDTLFSISTATLDQIGLSILDARIMTTKHDYAFDTFNIFQVLEQSGQPVNDAYRIDHICNTLRNNLLHQEIKEHINLQRISRQAQYFPIPTDIQFLSDSVNDQTILELITTDRQGLLAQIGKVFNQQKIKLHNAKITTIGSRVEDVFYITDSSFRPLSDPIKQEQLRKELLNVLGN
ncbi:MAG: [protein-PII] uridylyltransferase [Methylococcaceae bacterium]